MKAAAPALLLLHACSAPAPVPPASPATALAEEAPGDRDRFVVVNTVDRMADGTLTNCRFTDLPSEEACDVWRGPDGPAAFARDHRPGQALRLSLIVDVRPWTGRRQPVPATGLVEQVVLLGGEDEEACARLPAQAPTLTGWAEVAACPLVPDAGAFFAGLADPRPRQSTWTLTAEPLPR